jgi:Holliday junction resolvase
MSLHRRNPRRDANETEIVRALEAQGFVVDRVSGAGIPDLLISKGGAMWLAEVKMPKGTFKPSQVLWRQRFQGPVPVTLRSVEDALHFSLLACEKWSGDASRDRRPA